MKQSLVFFALLIGAGLFSNEDALKGQFAPSMSRQNGTKSISVKTVELASCFLYDELDEPARVQTASNSDQDDAQSFLPLWHLHRLLYDLD